MFVECSYRYRVGVIYLKLSRLVISVGSPGGKQVEKHLQQVHVFSSHIRDLEDGTHPRGKQHTHTHTLQRSIFTYSETVWDANNTSLN